MTRNQQDGDWPPKPPKTNPLDDLRWETINNPTGQFAKLVHYSNMLIWLAVSLALAIAIVGVALWFVIWMVRGAIG